MFEELLEQMDPLADIYQDLYQEDLMTVVDLYTREGAVVVRVPILPYATPPEAILWGERLFVKRADGKYYEGFCHYVTRFETNAISEPGEDNGHGKSKNPDDETKKLR